MPSDAWPRQPPPSATGPSFHLDIHRPAELRTLRAAIRSWLPDTAGQDPTDDAVLDTLLLAVDELASNGLRHGGAPVTVTIIRTVDGLFIDVGDSDPGHGPEPAVDRDPAHGGMGLSMVCRVTTGRGWTTTDGRKHVWVCIPTGPAPGDHAIERSG